MPNPVKGEASFRIEGDREITLVLDMEALIEAEQAYGKPLEQTMAEAQMGFVGAIRALLYGAMRAHHPEIDKAETLEIFMANRDAVEIALNDASQRAYDGIEAKEGKEKTNPPRRRPGASSGRNGAKQTSTQKPSGAKRRAHTT